MKLTWPIELLQWFFIGAMFIVAALVWPHVPDRIAIHWNLQGVPDGYGGKFLGLLLLPLMSLVLYLFLIVLPRFDPGYRNYRSFAEAYAIIRVSLMAFMALIYSVTVLAALGKQIDVGATVAVASGSLLMVIGNLMGKIRPNWFVGVRTPWTLSSKLSWTKTHRLAGWLFVLLGPMVAATGITGWPWVFGLTCAAGLGSLVWLVVYSYLVWRRDPQRDAPAGTSPGSE